MSQTASNPKPPSRLKKILQGLSDDQKQKPARRPADAPSSPAEPEYRFRSRFLPAFWTVASLLSLIVNVVLIGILLMLWLRPYDQFSGILGGLYNNFVKMDQATIRADIPVQTDISVPLNLNIPVTIPTVTANIRLTAPALITGVGVQIEGGPVTVRTDNATITLPAETPLSVRIENLSSFVLPVQDQIFVPVSLNVPVNIPLNQTQLHEPFVGLQEVVRPYYCLLEPNATVNGILVCSPLANPGIQPTPTFPVVP